MNHLTDPTTVRALMARWSQHGWLRVLDAAFADFLADEAPDAPPLLLLAAALASHQLGRGHPCLDLEQTLADPGFALSLPPEGDAARADADADLPPLPAAVLAPVSLADWLAALGHPQLVGEGAGSTPLVRVGSRLYLRRYWQYEQSVRAGIEARSATPLDLSDDVLRASLAQLFPPDPALPQPDWQKVACALAARSAFAILTGGPGTGKTTTVVRLLAVLQSMALAEPAGRALRIRLAAPTGKAAARLNASIAGAVDRLNLAGLCQGDALRAAIPREVTTLHRLLGTRPDTRHFRHHAGNPLPVDALVIDEASMVDLEMMAAVLDALPPGARLILLGDKDQLASVEAGAVLGQLCSRAEAAHYTQATVDWLARFGAPVAEQFVDPSGSPLDQGITMLRHSYRFDVHSGIGQLAKAVNAGEVDALHSAWAKGHADIARVDLAASGTAALQRLVAEGSSSRAPAGQPMADTPVGYRHYLEILRDTRPQPGAGQAETDDWARRVLAAHSRFQLLCALRRGAWGVDGLNLQIATWLCAEGLIPRAEGWYSGRPVLVTRNDYSLGLMNGDIGITLELHTIEGSSDLRVAFPIINGSDGIKWVKPSRLQAVETVYALTVHKSQGSEFEHAALVLPDRINPILTRELVYTGITRAKRWFSLIEAGNPAVLEQAVQRRVLRVSGLMES